MSIVNDKYETIAPQIDYLSDKVILAQAWKKTNSYIRRHNWYADVLELDCATVDLENRLEDWAGKIENETYQVDEMRLVLAPKNKQWYFSDSSDKFDSWSPKSNKQEEQRLRPLAHLTIRDQTVSTAVMLCLADAVETLQGPTDESDFLVAQRQQIYSYGNRLHCEWELYPQKRKKARFGWGNSRCYRQYYDDYKTFLSRPRSICQHYSPIISPNKNLYVVSLDLEEFYDHIDVNAMIGELRRLYNDYFKKYNLAENLISDADFWSKTREIFSWKWAEDDSNWSDIMPGGQLPKGLPQGLVSSGFLSNAYLIGFDEKVGERITKTSKDSSFRLLDYCRYVDDIRLVVEVSKELSMDEVKVLSEVLISKLLKEHQDNIGSESLVELNKGKTKAIPYQQLSTQNNVSSLMNMFQSVLSGTPDEESLRQASGGLEGLLQTSNQLTVDESGGPNSLILSKITTSNIDVRDDTLKRFIATRMVKSLRLRRSMTDLNERLGNSDSEHEKTTAGQVLDHEFETAARKLIACWASNPSLSLLLRCGLDLYPDPMLLVPVIDALKVKLYSNPPKGPEFLREIKVAEYVVADLLRAAATDIGYKQNTVYPDSADLEEFREELASFARELLTERVESPWYIKQQAVLFLISIGDYSFSVDFSEKELNQYALLKETALYHLTPGVNFHDILTVSLVTQQISPNPIKYCSWFIDLLNQNANNEDQKQAIQVLFMIRPDLLTRVIKSRRMRTVKWKMEISNEIKNALEPAGVRKVTLKRNTKISLLRIIQSDSNPFKQENALLLLAKAILICPDSEKNLLKGATVCDISIECEDWAEIQQPKQTSSFLKISYENFTNSNIHQIPSWVVKKYRWIYALGRILRSSITGEYDFTSNAFLTREDLTFYRGIKSTWFTRGFGISNHPRGLLSEPSPISPWLSEFLIRLLQWPGIRQWGELIQEFDQVRHSGDVLNIIEKRLVFQRKIFGRLSNTPFYTIPVLARNAGQGGKVKVAVVQPLLPKMSDFNAKDPMHWTPSYRAKHRNHIASICNLVSSHLKATRSAQITTKENVAGSMVNDVDLIVFPELSVHPDDIDLLRGLSDAVKTNIFSGLTFIQPNAMKAPINQALWILRNERPTGREFVYVHQGKKHMTKNERLMGIESYRPYQVVIELGNAGQGITRLAGAICYDATDLALVADLREISDIFVIAAMNQDVETFDNMVAALHYHMYQPVILANTGEFGGSTAQAPFNKHARRIAHIHGNQQVGISIFEVDTSVFKGNLEPVTLPNVKTPPAGYKGRD